MQYVVYFGSLIALLAGVFLWNNYYLIPKVKKLNKNIFAPKLCAYHKSTRQHNRLVVISLQTQCEVCNKPEVKT